MEKFLYKIKVFGRVQGVGFRRSVVSRARQTGLKGFVRNLSDGSVYIEIECDPGQLIDFISWCRESPGYSWVEDVEAEKGPLKNHSQFSIRY